MKYGKLNGGFAMTVRAALLLHPQIGRHLNTVSVQKYNRTRLNLDACVLSIKW